MMNRMIVTLVLLSISTKANTQLHCFVCENCTVADDEYASVPCDSILPPPNYPILPTTAIAPPTAPTAPTPTPIIRLRFGESSHAMEYKKTTELPLTTTTTTQAPSIPSFVSGSNNDTIVELNQFSGPHECFRLVRIGDDGQNVVVRGCVVSGNSIHETCVRANHGVAPRACRLCPINDCNNAAYYTTSMTILLSWAAAVTFLR